MRKPYLLLVLSILLLGASSMPALSSSQEVGLESERPSDAPRLIVYCFHGQFRCFTCMKMEEYTGDTLVESFSDELRSGEVIFQVINLGEPANRHFFTDYQLGSWSVVLSLREEGREIRFKNLAGIKNLVKDRQAFISYLFSEVESFLDGD